MTIQYTAPWGETIVVDMGDQAQHPIYLDGELTPWQTADACHCPHRALSMCVEYLGIAWYTDQWEGRERELVDALYETGEPYDDAMGCE